MRARSGFTLIEILVVLAVVGTLAALVAPNVLQHVGTAKTTAARSQLEILAASLDIYRLDNGDYPDTERGLAALWERPSNAGSGWNGPYLRKRIPQDPWGNPYVYRYPGTDDRGAYDLISLGADGQPGGTGDASDIGIR
jgi:general secretion pathway protein G